MKQIITTLAIIFVCTMGLHAQENNNKEFKFSHENFQAKQRAFITENAKLTAEEADKFFPLFFELQKEKWEINRNVRNKFHRKRGEKLTDQECNELIHEFADAKIEIAELEKKFIDKYLKIIPARKILNVQRAEDMFQKEILKNMTQRGARRNNERRR